MESSNLPGATPAVAHFASQDVGNRIDLQMRVMACLRQIAPGIHTAVHVTAIGSTVAIRGELPTEQVKHLCLERCHHVPGVIRLVDELTVGAESSTCNDADEWLS